LEQPKPNKIDVLLANERFQEAIRSLDPHDPIPANFDKVFKASKKELVLARELIVASRTQNDTLDFNNRTKIWNGIEVSVESYEHSKKKETDLRVYTKSLNWKKVIAYAAVISGLIFLGTWSVLDQTKNTDQIATVIERIEKVNPAGQKSRITLPDGSIVHLNAESELYYEPDFMQEDRKIYLSRGEAYFEVSKNKDKPFIVIVNDLTVTALGTAFNVNTFNQDLQVALVEGSVLVSNVSSDEQLIMEPSEVLEVNHQTNRFSILSNKANLLSEWKDQVINFDDTPIDEAVKTLSRWYAVNIIYEHSPPSGLTVSGRFNNKSLELVLENLSYSLNLKYKMEGKDIVLTFNR